MKKVSKEDRDLIVLYGQNTYANSKALHEMAKKYNLDCGCNSSTIYKTLVEYMNKNSE